jgi:dTDP-4-amino-4,6-dideoxy-D-glucose acyltransferase
MVMLSRRDIESMGFASLGENVQISDKASFYCAGRITIGSNTRIDDFCILAAGTGGIEIGSYVHLAVGTSLIGAALIRLSDFSGLSSRVSIYSSSDDYSGETLTNPTVPDEFKNVRHAPVYLGRHVIVGSGSVILPGVTLEDGVAVGALSLVNKDCAAFGIYAGNPIRRVKERKRNLLDLEKMLAK